MALKALGSPTEHWDHLLVPIILNRLDKVTRRSWEKDKSSSAEPSTFEEIKEFLRKKIVILEAMPCVQHMSAEVRKKLVIQRIIKVVILIIINLRILLLKILHCY